MWEKFQTVDQTLEMYILWERTYFTSDVNVVKASSKLLLWSFRGDIRISLVVYSDDRASRFRERYVL